MAKYIEKVQQMLQKQGADAVILQSKTMKKYIHTLTGSGCKILITKDKGYIFLDGRYLEEAREKEKDLEIWLVKNDMHTEIIRFLDVLHCSTIALEDSTTSVRTYQKYINNNLKVQRWDEELEMLRIIKEEEEIEKIQYAVDVADDVFACVKSQIHAGMSEYEISALLQYHAISKGATQMSFDTIVSSGPRTAFPHGRPTDRRIKRNEPIMIDFGVQMNNYQSDITRMLFIGAPTQAILEIYETVYEAQTTALSKIRSGMRGKDVDVIARSIIENRGYGEFFGHGLGHGIGIGDGSELPYLNPSSNTVLQENMLMSCEPGVYVPGVGGVRIEDDVLIKNGIGIALNHTSKELCIL